MTIVNFVKKMIRFALRNTLLFLFQYPRFLKYKLLSNCSHVTGKPKLYQPIQINGKGQVVFDKNVRIGVNPSPYLYSGYAYIDSRKENSRITLGENIWINNNFVVIAEGEGIEIGANTLIGTNCQIVDSDFHDLNPNKRMGGKAKTAKVSIGKNVFIGSNVVVLKGVKIGDNTVIANGSVVTKSIPENVIAGGVPAKMIRSL
jgi:maltose O-acetyltransferase